MDGGYTGNFYPLGVSLQRALYWRRVNDPLPENINCDAQLWVYPTD